MSGDHTIPRIGITLSARATGPKERRRAERTTDAYRAALERHGAAVVELRPGDSVAALDSLDGLLLAGGGDVDPRHYGREAHPRTGRPDAARDALELELARAAVARGMPVLGICRGAQALGVALGGQLVQDIDSEVPGAEEHTSPDKGRGGGHRIELAPGSRLASIFGARRLRVNTSHHQANALLGPGVIRTAWSADGVIEGIEADGNGFVVGVQWHPERMWRRSPRQRRLFSEFVEACRNTLRRDREG